MFTEDHPPRDNNFNVIYSLRQIRNKQMIIEINRNETQPRNVQTREKTRSRASSHSSLVYRSNKRPAKNCRGCRSKPPLPPPLLLLVAVRDYDKGHERGCVREGQRHAKVRGCYEVRSEKKKNRSMLQCSGDLVRVTTRSGDGAKLFGFCSIKVINIINRHACNRIHFVNLQKFSNLQPIYSD